MSTISARLDPKEAAYLKSIAEKNELFSGEIQSPSLGKALKAVVKWCAYNEIDLSKNHDVFDDDLRKMIEQIHVSIPNLMYLSRMNTLLSEEEVPKEKMLKNRDKALNYINAACGEFQSSNYKNLRVSINSFGLKQIPCDKEKTLWK